MSNAVLGLGTINGIAKLPIDISAIQLASTAFLIVLMFSLKYTFFAIKHSKGNRYGINVVYTLRWDVYGIDDFDTLTELNKTCTTFQTGFFHLPDEFAIHSPVNTN